jgi:hypothetical protein
MSPGAQLGVIRKAGHLFDADIKKFKSAFSRLLKW